MPQYVITAPDGKKYRVSGEGTADEALAHFQQNYKSQQQPSVSAQPSEPVPEQSGFKQRALGVLGDIAKGVGSAGELGAHVISGAAGSLGGGLTYLGTLAATGGDIEAAKAVQEGTQSALTYQPRLQTAQTGARAVQEVMAIPGQIGTAVGDKTLDAMNALGFSPEVSATTAATIAAVPDAALQMLGLRAGEKGSAAIKESGAAKVKETPIPTKQELKSGSQAAYKRAEEAGVIIKPESFEKSKNALVSTLEKEGIDPTLHPSTTAALKRITETEGPLTLEKLETLRKIAKSAESTINGADKRLAYKVVDHIDDYMQALKEGDVSSGNPKAATAALAEARNLWSRTRKTDVIDELMQRAELSASNFTGSGLENAIRTEFRALAKNPRRMKTFTAEEQAAIKRVVQGGKIENGLRMFGKFAPTGVVSAALSGGAGFAAGGPLGAVALPLAGAAARKGATAMTMRNVNRAQELMRRGPKQIEVAAPAAEQAKNLGINRRANVMQSADKAPATGAAVVKTGPGEWTVFKDRKPLQSYTDEATANSDLAAINKPPRSAAAIKAELELINKRAESLPKESTNPKVVAFNKRSTALKDELAKVEKPAHDVQLDTGELGEVTAKTANGEVLAQESGPYLQVKRSDVAKGSRGHGEGIAMIVRLFDEAAKRKLKLASDFSVSPDAINVYKALERRGFTVKQNPATRNSRGGLVSADPRVPVFEVTKK